MPYAAAGGAANQLFAPTTAAGGWGMEVVLTFALVYLVLSSTDSERAVDAPHLPVRTRERWLPPWCMPQTGKQGNPLPVSHHADLACTNLDLHALLAGVAAEGGEGERGLELRSFT